MYPPRKVGQHLIPPIGYGAMGFGGAYYGAAAPDEERFELLDKLYEMGSTMWDTAHIYGDSEETIGKWFQRTGLRDTIFLASKGGIDLTATSVETSIRGDAAFIKSQVELSLKRLQTDHIDLYYIHRTDPHVPIEETMKVLKGFVEQGTIRYIGLSEASVGTMRRAHAVHPVSAIQIEYSPFQIEPEVPGGVLEVARELGMTIFAYSPTGRGLATGRYKSPADFPADDLRLSIPKFSAENFPRILSLSDSLAKIGKAHNASAAQVTIAWLLALAPDIIPLPGSKKLSYTEENWKAGEIVLSEEEMKEVRTLVDEMDRALGKVFRMPAYGMAHSWVDTPLPSEEGGKV